MFRIFVIPLLTVSFVTRANPSVENRIVSGIAEFTAAYQAWDGAAFSAAAKTLREAAATPPPTATAFYWLGVTEFHRMLRLQNPPNCQPDKPAAEFALGAAVDALTTAVKLDKSHAESHALLATLHGMRIGGNLLRALRYGPLLEKHRRLALGLGSGNPRVQYLLGVCQFHTARKPNAMREALATLLKAESLFEGEAKVPPGPLDPRWGHSTCLTFIGRAYEQLRQPNEAAAYFRKALAAHPADHLAAEGLKRVTEQK